jgi:hypothetical protein
MVQAINDRSTEAESTTVATRVRALKHQVMWLVERCATF